MKRNDKPVLEFVAIKRRDCSEWAIPGVSVFVKLTPRVADQMEHME